MQRDYRKERTWNWGIVFASLRGFGRKELNEFWDNKNLGKN